jgi:hypothetical protein
MSNRRFRRGARFATEWRFTPPDRNQRARIMHLAETLERKTKPEGKKNGALHGPYGLQVLRTLLFGFMNAKTGRCDPSYSDLEERTGFSRDTIADCLHDLEASGILLIMRRMVRVVINGVRMPRQITNAYAFGEPKIAAAPTPGAPPAAKLSRAFPAKASPLETWLKSLRSSASLNRRDQLPLDLKTSGFQWALGAEAALHG